MALRKSWNAVRGGKNGTAPAAQPADDDTLNLRELEDDGADEDPETPAPADAVADDPDAAITAADAREIFTGLVNVAARLEAIEKRMDAGSRGAKPAATTSAPAAPRKAAVDPLRPSASTVAEWARAAHAVGARTGRWDEARDVAALVASMILEPALALTRASETADDPSRIEVVGDRPTGAPIFLSRIALAVLELATAWGVDIDAAMQVCHEDAIASQGPHPE